MELRTIALEEARNMVFATIEKYPENRNPHRGIICLNTDVDGNHCMVAQALTDHGVVVPDYNHLLDDAGVLGLAGNNWFGEIGVMFTEEALGWLRTAQMSADRVEDVNKGGSSDRRAWGTLRSEIEAIV